MRSMQKKMAVLVLVALVAAGCNTTPAEKAYLVLGSATIAMETSADYAEGKMGEPAQEVVLALQAAATIATPAFHALKTSADNWIILDAQIKGIRQAGGNPSLVMLRLMDEATKALLKTHAETLGDIMEIVTAANKIF